MHSTLRQRLGSGIAVVGLTVLATAGAFTTATSAGAEERTSPVCNNLHQGEDPATCHTGGPYGDVDWDITGGQLVLHVTASEGIGWSGIRVCGNYGPPTNGADCQPNDAGRLPTAAYSVAVNAPAGGTASSQDGKTYTFEPCSSEFVVTVPTSAIVGAPADWWWAIHLTPGGGEGCGGVGTQEAFGLVRTSTTTTTGGQGTTTTTSPTTTTTTAGDTTTTTSPSTTTTTTAGQGTTTTTTTTTTGDPVTGGGATAPTEPQVLGEQLVENPAPAVDPQAIATLPRTGARTPELLALAGLALLLGGVAIRLGKPATER